MASSLETRKNIFKYNSQGQLELPELIAKTPLNKIEFRPNDGIYINDVRLSAGGGGGTPVGNSVDADYDLFPPVVVTNSVPFGKTEIVVDSIAVIFASISNSTIRIPYTENPAKPFSEIDFIIPIIRSTDGKGWSGRGVDYRTEFVFDKTAGTFTMDIIFDIAYGGSDSLAGYTLLVDFLVV